MTEKYRKKPVTVEAVKWTGDNLQEVIKFTGLHPKFNEWFDSFEEYERYVNKKQTHISCSHPQSVG